MIPDTSNLVSCVMVTQAKRLAMAQRALKSFLDQTYARKELIIVYDEPEFAARTLLKTPLGGPRVFTVRAPEGMSLGDLRNYGIARANGAYIAQWDDDDWSHPTRLEMQMRALQAQPDADACVLSRWTLAWPSRDLYSVSYERDWEGSVVGRRERMAIYGALDRGEDTEQLKGLKLTHVDLPELYVYVVHGSNTWPQQHFEAMFSASERPDLQLTETRKSEIRNILGV